MSHLRKRILLYVPAAFLIGLLLFVTFPSEGGHRRWSISINRGLPLKVKKSQIRLLQPTALGSTTGSNVYWVKFYNLGPIVITERVYPESAAEIK
jgi:hypothetical protein